MLKQMQKKNLLFWLIFILLTSMFAFSWHLRLAFADNLRLTKGDSYYVNLQTPFSIYVNLDKEGIIDLNGTHVCKRSNKFRITNPLTMEAMSLGKVKLEFSLFGIIPFRQMTVNIVPEIKLLPGGHSIGIKLYSEGVIVTGFHIIEQKNYFFSPAEKAGVKIGDTIIAVEGETINSINEAAELLAYQGSKGKITLTIRRAGKLIELSVSPMYAQDAGSYRIGLYIRDTAAGVGTLSFYEKETGRYGALGHVIMDSETKAPFEIKDGRIVEASIVSIEVAKRGQPGEKSGVFVEHDGILGSISKNTRFGIFGNIFHIDKQNTPRPYPLPLATSSQVKEGPAEILTVIEGEEIESFAIEIENVITQGAPSTKSMIIRVVDEELLSATGGIVQGMSGSPIIQNEKLVGAVTHVFINDPTRGYGIFMEWMAKKAGLYN